MYRKSHCVVIRTHHVLKPFFSLFPTWCQVVPLSLPSVLSLDIFSSFLKTPYMECLEYHLETRLTRIFLFFFLSFTNLMRVWWGIHLGRRPKLGPGGSSREGQISAACAFWSPSPRLERGWFPKLGLWRHHLGTDELTGQPGPCGRDWGVACLLGSLLCAGLCLSAGSAGSCCYEWCSEPL